MSVWGQPTKGSDWLAMRDPTPWASGSPCSQTDADLWHPPPGQSGLAAKRICWGSCDVRQTCLNYAIEEDIEEGVYGGATSRDRWKLKHGRPVVLEPPPVRRREPKPVPVITCRWCSKTFQGHSSCRYCSAPCRELATAARKKAAA